MGPSVFETRIQRVIDKLRRVSGPKKGHEPDSHPEMHKEARSLMANWNNQNGNSHHKGDS